MKQPRTDDAPQRKRNARKRNARRRKALPALIALALLSALALCQLGISTKRDTAQTTDSITRELATSEDDTTSEWASRIDAFNAGYPLEGYGYAFAAAAEEYGIDPRLSPAIARTESGSGQVCSYPHNAWGWGTMSWPDWESAIYAHVEGLATNYTTELTYEMAQRYCPDDPDEWYAQVDSVLNQI